MPLDPSIFLTARPKSAFDYLKDMAEVEDAKQNRQLRGLQLLAQQGQMQDAQQARDIRNRGMSAVQALGGSATNEQRISALRGVGDYGTADALEKSDLERQKTGAEVSKNSAEVEKTKLANAISRQAQIAQAAGAAVDQASWEQGLKTVQALGVDVSNIPLQFDPKLAVTLRNQAMTGAQQLEQVWKQKEFDQGARNDLIGPDGKVNQPLLNAKQQVAAAGKTTVSVNTGQKGLENELHLRSDFKQEPIYKAHQEVQSAYQQIKAALGQQSPAGDLAGATKIMKLLDPGSVVRESELGMAMAATGLLDRLTNYAQMRINGTKLTPDQRKDFQTLADKLYSASVDQYNAKRGEYENLASGYGLNSGRALGPQSSPPKPSSSQSGAKVVDFNSLKE